MPKHRPCHTNPFLFNGTIIKGTIAVLEVQERRPRTQPGCYPEIPRFYQRPGISRGLRKCPTFKLKANA